MFNSFVLFPLFSSFFFSFFFENALDSRSVDEAVRFAATKKCA